MHDLFFPPISFSDGHGHEGIETVEASPDGCIITDAPEWPVPQDLFRIELKITPAFIGTYDDVAWLVISMEGNVLVEQLLVFVDVVEDLDAG